MTRPPALIVGCLVLLTACAEEPEPVTLPTLAPSELAGTSASPTTASPSVTAAEEREHDVRETYIAAIRGFYTAQAMPAHRQRAYLAKWETGTMLEDDLALLKKARDGHYRLVGRPSLDIRDITVDGDTAVVEDCVDHSEEYWEDDRTGRAIAGSRQAAGVWAFTTLVETDAGWRASKTSAKKKRCSSG